MTAFAYELASVLQAQAAARPGDPEGPYAMPWYLVIGDPGTGRSSAIKAMNLEWPYGDGPIPMNMPEQMCSYWIPKQAVFIEPGPRVAGPSRQQGMLGELCDELRVKRAREPIDGIVLIVNAQVLADSNEDSVDEYAKGLRRMLIEVAQALAADVPVYIVVTAIDTLWGFGDVFRWTSERRDEEPWGFSLPPGLDANDAPEHIKGEIEGLVARIESFCFAKVSSEDDARERVRAFQHVAEARDLVAKLGQLLQIVSMANAFERAPWVRACAIGSGMPGTGHRLRHNVDRFSQMGLYPPQESGTPFPGGMPLHAYLEAVLIPERDIVPTRVRWRDDWLLILLIMFGGVAWVGILIIMITRWVT